LKFNLIARGNRVKEAHEKQGGKSGNLSSGEGRKVGGRAWKCITPFVMVLVIPKEGGRKNQKKYT